MPGRILALAVVLLSAGLVPFAHGANGNLQTEPVASLQATPFILPVVKRDSLLNGLQLIVLEQPNTGAVAVRLRVNSGAMFDLAGKGGLADVTAGMLLKGGGGWTAKNISDAVEQAGLKLNITAGWDATDIEVDGPADALETIIDLLSRIVVNPAFDQKELDGFKSSRIGATKQELAADAIAVRRGALLAIFGATPFGKSERGSAESIAQITRQDLTYYHNRFYLANDAELLVVGDAAAEKVTRLSRAHLGSWRKGDKVPATFRPPDVPTARRIIILDRAESQSSYAIVGQVGISRRAADYYAVIIMADLLAQATAKLGSAVKGATMQTEMEARLLPGPLIISINAPQSDAPALIDGALDAMTNLQAQPPSLDALEAAKARVIGATAERLRTPEGAAQLVLEIETYGLGRDYLINYAKRLNALAPADIQHAAQTHLTPKTAAVVIAGTSAKLESAMKKLGSVTVARE